MSIAVGGYHTLALSRDGYVYAWGLGSSGQLGGGKNETSAAPVKVLLGAQDATDTEQTYLHDIVAIAAGYNYSLALDKDGYVYAWGDNNTLELGNGDDRRFAAATRNVPVRVVNGTAAGPHREGDPYNYLAHIVDISAADGHVMALRSNGTVVAWGRNEVGQLGIGETTNNIAKKSYIMAPAQVKRGESDVKGSARDFGEFLQGAMTLTTGGSYINNTNTPGYSLILTVNNAGEEKIYGLGSNTYGQLGRDASILSSTAAPILTLDVKAADNIITDRTSTVGGDEVETVTTTTGSLANERVVQLEGGAGHVMLRTIQTDMSYGNDTADLTQGWRSRPDIDLVYVMGRGSEGQMGDLIRQNASKPVRVVKGEFARHEDTYTYLTGVYEIGTGYFHNVTLNLYYNNDTGSDHTKGDDKDGRFGYPWAWGMNTDVLGGQRIGQIGSQSADIIDYPTQAGLRESLFLIIDFAEVAKANDHSTVTHAYGTPNVATARLSNTPLNTNETVPSDITLGFDDHFVVFRDNTHLEYNSGFSLYPMYLTLPTNDEVWTLSSSDVSIGGVAEMSSDAIYAYAAGQGKEDSAAITMRADYYNHSGPGTTNFALGTVTGDYGVTHTNDDPHVLLTGVYVGSILLNFQEAGDAIISNVVAGSSFTVFLDGDGSVWALSLIHISEPTRPY